LASGDGGLDSGSGVAELDAESVCLACVEVDGSSGCEGSGKEGEDKCGAHFVGLDS
jgi:hypothetical protein